LTLIPEILHICHESQKGGFKRYKTAFNGEDKNGIERRRIYVDPDIDTLYVRIPQWTQEWYDSGTHFDPLDITQGYLFTTALVDTRLWNAAKNCLTKVLVKAPIIRGGACVNDEVVFIARKRDMSIKDRNFSKGSIHAEKVMRTIMAKFDLAWGNLGVVGISRWGIVWRYLFEELANEDEPIRRRGKMCERMCGQIIRWEDVEEELGEAQDAGSATESGIV